MKLFDIKDFPRIGAAKGLVEGVDTINVTGVAFNLPAGIGNDLVNGGITEYVFPDDNGESMEVTFDIADAGKTVAFQLLDENYNEVTEVVLLDTSPVSLPGTYTRCNGGSVVGNQEITQNVILKEAGGINEYCVILVEPQRAWHGVYTIPDGHEAYANYLVGTMRKSSGTDTDVTIGVSAREVGGVFITDFGFGLQRSGGTVIEFIELSPSKILARTDLKFDGISSASGSEVLLRLGLDILRV